MSKHELEGKFNPKDFEDEIYENWEKKGYFKPSNDKSKKPYTIVIPPPNITGRLHMGHALDETLQDILIRYKRMAGFNALWVPGTDHASIATEAKIVAKLKEEGITKEDLGREEFLKRAWDWKKEYGGIITKQIRKLGSSCDWSRERFTLDEGLSNAVQTVFINLYNKGLIYRGERMINWCPTCHTSISDSEVEYEQEPTHLWHIKYPIKGEEGKYLIVATTRPETMLGDTGVAVNPNDERYKAYIGKTVVLPIVGREIPIIAADFVETEFGTGAVKLTPAHDVNDYQAGLDNNLEMIKVFDENGIMNDIVPEFAGLDIYEARKRIVEKLKEIGALIKIEDYTHDVGKCYRCHQTIEPMISKQWFVKMEPLAKPAIEAVKTGKTRFIPERFEKTYFNWLENIKDWCISRQLWWGHRIPAYYCDDCGEIMVGKEMPAKCDKCGSTHLHQDEDTLDTWFSSALWPFSTLGWPEQTEDFKYFYPTSTQGFQDKLTELVEADGGKVEFDVQNASGESANCSTIVNGFVSAGDDLIMANATAALQAAQAATSDIPILGTSVTDYGTALGISDWTGKTGTNISGTTDLAPLDGQADMLKELFPDAKNVGLLYCSAEPNSKYQIDTIKPLLEAQGYTCTEFAFTDSNDVASVAQNAASGSDVIYIPTDNTAASCTEAIANVVIPAKVPVIAGEQGICSGCGVATLSIDYNELGQATGEMAYEILVKGANPGDMEVQAAPTFTKMYNKANCEKLGITIPDDYTAIEG